MTVVDNGEAGFVARPVMAAASFVTGFRLHSASHDNARYINRWEKRAESDTGKDKYPVLSIPSIEALGGTREYLCMAVMCPWEVPDSQRLGNRGVPTCSVRDQKHLRVRQILHPEEIHRQSSCSGHQRGQGTFIVHQKHSRHIPQKDIRGVGKCNVGQVASEISRVDIIFNKGNNKLARSAENGATNEENQTKSRKTELEPTAPIL